MPNFTKFQRDILAELYDIDNLNTRERLFAGLQENHPNSKISKAMVAEYVREWKKPKTSFVEDPVLTENHETDKKHRYNPSTGFYLDKNFDNYEASRLVDISKLVDSLFFVHKLQKFSKDTEDKSSKGLVDLMTEHKANELLQLFFNMTLASLNSILTNKQMRGDLLRALDIKNIQEDIFLINKGLFGDEEEKEKARLEYEQNHEQSEESGDESEEEAEEIEKEKPVKLKHHLINSVVPFEAKSEDVSDLRSGRVFI